MEKEECKYSLENVLPAETELKQESVAESVGNAEGSDNFGDN